MACVGEANPCCSSIVLNRYQGQGLVGLGQNRNQMRSVHFLANLLRFKPWSRVSHPFVATFFEFVKVRILTITFFSSWRLGIFCNRLIILRKYLLFLTPFQRTIFTILNGNSTWLLVLLCRIIYQILR